jgi:hypothetical protein
MKKYLLLPLVALGLIAWLPNEAKAGVHVTFGFGPAYYEPYYGYYPGYTYYYHPYWYHRHHRYHHYDWHRW